MKKTFNIEEVIRQRLQLDSVKRKFFNLYDVLEPTLDKFKSPHFLKQYINWTPEQQKSFLIELGGPVNIKHTRKLFEGLSKELLTKENK